MSDHNPYFHQRHSIRLKGYDYSKAGFYFITICVQNRECLFGEIRTVVGAPLRGRLDIPEIQGVHKVLPQKEMTLNDPGKMITKWYCELEKKFPAIRCYEMIVMPNHFHCIIEITGKYGNNDSCTIVNDHSDGIVNDYSDGIVNDYQGAHVGAPLRGRPNDQNTDPPNDQNTDPPNDQNTNPPNDPISEHKYGPDNKKYVPTIGDVVGWFKTMTTNEYIRGVKNQGWKRFYDKLWQRNYWEHVIRNDESYHQISEYIMQNPSKWNDDQLNPDHKI